MQAHLQRRGRGLDPAIFDKCLTVVEITAKVLFVYEIRQSGCYILVMSMSGHLGGDSGQNMDKTETPTGGHLPTPSSSNQDDQSQTLPPPRILRRQAQTDEKRENVMKNKREIDRLVLEAHKTTSSFGKVLG